jgi:uncharacterized phage protein (TIGR01671 family)
MSEIIFRGLKKDGKFVYGSLVTTNNFIKKMPAQHTKHWIISSAFGNGGWFNVQRRAHVRSETVGQFTGLKDKNGTYIYEGDIVMHENGIQTVEYVPSIAAFSFGLSNCVVCQEWGVNGDDMEVIGNIHQNPDLIK